jgi:hypothetical protein
MNRNKEVSMNRLISAFFLVLLTVTCAWSAGQFEYPQFQALDSNGIPLEGGKLYTYITGTTTNKATYSNAGLTIANSNPITLDARGEAEIYGTGTYKFVLKDSAGTTIWTVDPVYAANSTQWVDLEGAADAFVLDDDGDTTISAPTDDQIDIEVSGADQVRIVDGKIYPVTDDDIDIGDATHEFKDGYFDGTLTTDAFVCSGASIIGGNETVTGNLFVTANVLETTTATAVGTGAQTLSAAELLGGVIDEDPEGNATWTTDTAENIVAAITDAVAGTTFRCVLFNDATGASGEVVTLAGGVGVTMNGTTLTMTEGTNITMELIFRLTNVTAASEAVDCYVLTSQ